MNTGTAEVSERVGSSTLPLLESGVKRLRLPWYAATFLVAAILLGTLSIAVYVDVYPKSPFTWSVWRTGLPAPIIIAYILSIYPVISKMGNVAASSLKPLLKQEQAIVGDERPAVFPVPQRRDEWASLAVGAVFVLLLSQPWEGEFSWLAAYAEATGIAMFGLLALLIYYGLRDTRHLARISRKINLDIFNIDVLTPVARWSLTIALAFIGGIIISILFQSADSLIQWQVILIYVILVGAAVAIFFMMLWNTHSLIYRAKKRELNFVAQKLTASSRDLKRLCEAPAPDNRADLYYAVAAWGAYERRVRETKEWPFNAGIIGRLLVSTVSPAVVYLIKILSGAGFN